MVERTFSFKSKWPTQGLHRNTWLDCWTSHKPDSCWNNKITLTILHRTQFQNFLYNEFTANTIGSLVFCQRKEIMMFFQRNENIFRYYASTYCTVYVFSSFFWCLIKAHTWAKKWCQNIPLCVYICTYISSSCFVIRVPYTIYSKSKILAPLNLYMQLYPV